MEGLYGWVRNITCYLIFMAVVTQILPDKKYEKYIKLFSGMILILLVLKPVTGGLRLDDRLAYYFESISFQKEAGDFKQELQGAEQRRMEQMTDQYSQAVAADLEGMVRDAGFYPARIHASIDSDPNSQSFGTVKAVSLALSEEPVGESGAGSGPGSAAYVEPVEPVVIEKGGTDEGGAADETGEQPEAQGEEGDSRVRALRQRIANYYNLEAEYVEIRLEDE